MARRKGAMVKLGDALNGFARRADRRDGIATARVAGVWDEVVGDHVAQHTAGVVLKGDELLVKVDSHAWAAELETLSETLKDRVNSVLGEILVRHIRFTVSRKVADERRDEERVEDAKRRYGGEPVTPQPLSAEEREAVERSAAGIRSDVLREAAVRAAVRDLEWKKAQKLGKTGDVAPHEATDAKTGLLP